MRKVAITNIGKLVSGDLDKGILDATSILTKDNKIMKIGSEREIGAENADATIDANGLTVTPVFIKNFFPQYCCSFNTQRIFWIKTRESGRLLPLRN